VIVVDASALLEVIFRTSAAELIEKRLFEPRQTLHVPHLLDLEVVQVIRRYATTGEIDSERGRAALADIEVSHCDDIHTRFFSPASGSFGRTLPLTTPFMSRWRKRSTHHS